MTMVVGCKLLQVDGRSLNGQWIYRWGEWQEVPGNGAYVAISGGLSSAGIGPLLAYLECEKPTAAEAPAGVVCYRRVRWIAACPERIASELRGEVACEASDLSSAERLALAEQSTPEWRGRVARYASDLSSAERLALAEQSTPEWRGRVACEASDLSSAERLALAEQSTPEWRGEVACYASDLSSAERLALAEQSTPEWRGRVAAKYATLSGGL